MCSQKTWSDQTHVMVGKSHALGKQWSASLRSLKQNLFEKKKKDDTKIEPEQRRCSPLNPRVKAEIFAYIKLHINKSNDFLCKM